MAGADFYRVTANNQPKGSLTYQYKVHRDIISCENSSFDTWKCILKAEGGGK